MRRALTFLAITGLSLASKHHSEHRKPTDAIIVKPFSNDNKPVQVPYGAMDDEFRFVSTHRPIHEPYINRPVQVPYGAMDDDNEFRILFNPENPRPIIPKSFRELNNLGQAFDSTMDDEFYNHHSSKKSKEPVLGGKPTETPYLENQKKFQHIQFPNPNIQPGKPVEVPYGALDDEFKLVLDPKHPRIHEPYINRPVQVPYGALDDDEFHTLRVKAQEPVLGGRVVKTPYLENQKKFQHIQFPQPIIQEGKPVEVPYGALDDELHTMKKVRVEPIQKEKASFRGKQKKSDQIEEGKPVQVPYGAL